MLCSWHSRIWNSFQDELYLLEVEVYLDLDGRFFISLFHFLKC